MATGNATRYFARPWDDDDVSMFTWEHEYWRNFVAVVAAAFIVYAVASFCTYSIEQLLLLNFPAQSREWCFTCATEDRNKLQRTQLKIKKIAACLALFCRWPLGTMASVHLWECVDFIRNLLVLGELTFVALLGLLVGFIRLAHYTALVTGWEHPDSPVRAFSALDYSEEYGQFRSPPFSKDHVKLVRTFNPHASEVHWSSPFSESFARLPSALGLSKEREQSLRPPVARGRHEDVQASSSRPSEPDFTSNTSTVTSLPIPQPKSSDEPAPPKMSNSRDSSFMGFSPAAVSNSSWMKTRTFANSMFSNSTQSTSSRDSFGGPSLRRKSSLHQVQNASDGRKASEGPDLLTGSPRRNFP